MVLNQEQFCLLTWRTFAKFRDIFLVMTVGKGATFILGVEAGVVLMSYNAQSSPKYYPYQNVNKSKVDFV